MKYNINPYVFYYIIIYVLNIRNAFGNNINNNISNNCVITTQLGQIKGIENGNLCEYYGIPYATASRWLPPALWTKTYDSNIFNATRKDDYPICMQSLPAPLNLGKHKQSEECLSLNIYMNKNTKPNANVFFWIHGGSFMFGYADFYTNLATFVQPAQIVVTINYRLNIFGFLADSRLSKFHDPRRVSGNYAILDIQTALKWVQLHIKSFNGNPGSVTVAGQSSGATAIFMLMSSPASIGLFHAAICLSGSLNNSVVLKDAEIQNKDIITPCKNLQGKNFVDCALHLKSSELVKKYIPKSWSNFAIETLNKNDFAALGIVDGVTVKYSFENAMKLPIMDIPIIIQSTEQETELFSTAQHSFDVNKLNSWIKSTFTKFNSVDNVTKLYDSYIKHSNDLAYYTINADVIFSGNIKIATMAKNYKSPIYISQFDVSPKHQWKLFYGDLKYAFHMSDYFFVTKSWTWGKILANLDAYQPTEEDKRIGDFLLSIFVEMITNHKVTAFRSVQECGVDPCVNIITNNKQPKVDTNNNLKLSIYKFFDQLGVTKPQYWWSN